MPRGIALAALLFAVGCAAADAQQPATVESNGQHPSIKLDQLIAGHLAELDGKYRLRVTEVTYDPAGYIGPHHHVGPGIRCITAGELSYEQPDKTSVYRAGDCFFESGDVTHTAHNLTNKPVVLLSFEILPASQAKGSSIPVPK
jgi:quercetin dioxygenase-like cupin family protein